MYVCYKYNCSGIIGIARFYYGQLPSDSVDIDKHHDGSQQGLKLKSYLFLGLLGLSLGLVIPVTLTFAGDAEVEKIFHKTN